MDIAAARILFASILYDVHEWYYGHLDFSFPYVWPDKRRKLMNACQFTPMHHENTPSDDIETS